MYQEACKEWQQKLDADKTWTNFKHHFAADYSEIREQQRILGKAGFNSAQLAYETTYMATVLDNLELVATADCNIVADLVAINKKLVDTNTALVARLKSLVSTNARLANTQGTKYQKPLKAKITRDYIHIDPNGYCWYRRFKVCMGNSSITCGDKLQGYCDDAT